MKIRKYAAIGLCALTLCTAALTACNKASSSNATADEATTASATESVTITASETEAQTQPATVTNTTASTEAPAQSGNSDADSGVVGNNSGSPVSSPKTCIITVDNTDYTAKVGDVVTYNYYLKTPKEIENVQATLNYTGKSLKILNEALLSDPDEELDEELYDDLEKVFPVLGDSVIYNGNHQNLLKFNASKISGYDFTEGGYLITLKFEVISGVNASVSTAIEMMDEKGGAPYVDKFTFAKDVTHKESLTQ